MGTIQAVAEELQKLTTGFFSVPAGQPFSINLPLPNDPEVVGEIERKKMVESLLSKARAGQL
jgi:hypothetical protein